MALMDLLDRLVRQQSTVPAHFTIEDANILDERDPAEERFLTPQASYFEVRLKQMYLRNERELWRDFRPFGTFVAGFVHAGRLHEVPFIVGPEQLGNRTESLGGDAVEYRNLRIAGPFPYEGDDLQLFVALSRMVKNNWAVQALSMLETFAAAFDASKISSYLDIAGPLVSGIQGLLGMQDVELRLGVQRAYAQPVGRGGVGPDTLRARHEVLINTPEAGIDSFKRERFWVREGRLLYGDRPQIAYPYRDADFLLFEIRPLAIRGDYTTFDFHRVNWEETQKAIWDTGEEVARQKLKLTAASLVQCRDIVPTQRTALLRMYKETFDSDLALYREMFGESPVRDADTVVKKGLAAVTAVEERDMAALMRGARSDPALAGRSPEAMMAELGL